MPGGVFSGRTFQRWASASAKGGEAFDGRARALSRRSRSRRKWAMGRALWLRAAVSSPLPVGDRGGFEPNFDRSLQPRLSTPRGDPRAALDRMTIPAISPLTHAVRNACRARWRSSLGLRRTPLGSQAARAQCARNFAISDHFLALAGESTSVTFTAQITRRSRLPADDFISTFGFSPTRRC